MASSVQAASLSTITELAGNPPKYPRNPTEQKREPLVLYIARVPGSRGRKTEIFYFLIFIRSKFIHRYHTHNFEATSQKRDLRGHCKLPVLFSSGLAKRKRFIRDPKRRSGGRRKRRFKYADPF
jgi:hypothetical protein